MWKRDGQNQSTNQTNKNKQTKKTNKQTKKTTRKHQLQNQLYIKERGKKEEYHEQIGLA